MYNVYHGSWRDFGTAVGALSTNCSRENVSGETFCSLRSHGTRDKAGSIIDRCYRERVSVEVFCSLRSHGTRLLLTQQSKPCLVMGKAGVCACVVIS